MEDLEKLRIERLAQERKIERTKEDLEKAETIDLVPKSKMKSEYDELAKMEENAEKIVNAEKELEIKIKELEERNEELEKVNKEINEVNAEIMRVFRGKQKPTDRTEAELESLRTSLDSKKKDILDDIEPIQKDIDKIKAQFSKVFVIEKEEPKKEEPKKEEPKKEEPEDELLNMDEPVKEEPVKEEPEDELLNMDEPVKEEPKKEEPKVSKVVSAGVVASTAMTMSPEDKLKNYIENRHSMSFAERMETIKFLKNNRKALTRKSKKDLEISASVDADSFFEKNKGFDDTTSEKLFESIKAVMGTDLSDDKVTALCDAFNMKNERNFASAYDDVDRDTRKAVTKLVSKYYNEVSSDKEITPELSMISQYIVEPVKETVALSDTYEVKTNPFLNFVGKFGMINSHKKLSETLLTGERQMKDKKMAETISKSKKNTVTESTLEIEIKKAIENKKKGLDLSEQVENKEEVAKKDISDESKSPKKDTVKKMTK